jgi:hypothetical protein
VRESTFHQLPKRYLNYELLRWKGSKNYYPTNCQRRRSNQMFVRPLVILSVLAVETYAFLPGKQLRDDLHKWLSPSEPSKNHNIACGTHHKKTANWFFQGKIYQEWKSTGSLLWVHGKRSFCPAFVRMPSDANL